jgi:hypothetical protein
VRITVRIAAASDSRNGLCQWRQQLGRLPVVALVQGAIELPARRGERERLAPAIDGRRHPCNQSGGVELREQPAEAGRVQRQPGAQRGHVRRRRLAQLEDDARLGQRPAHIEQSLVQGTQAPRVETRKLAHGGDMR